MARILATSTRSSRCASAASPARAARPAPPSPPSAASRSPSGTSSPAASARPSPPSSAGVFRDRLRIYADCHAGDTPDPADYARKAKEVVAEGFTAIKFDLDTPNPNTDDISDDPHPRRQWYRALQPPHRLRRVEVDGRRHPRGARGRRPRDHGRDGRPLEVQRQRRHPAGAGARALRSPLARGSGAAREHRGAAPCHSLDAHAHLHRREPLPQARLPRADRKAGRPHRRARHPEDGRPRRGQEGRRPRRSLLHPVAPHNVASPIGTVAGATSAPR